MATMHAGVKRSYQDMRGIELLASPRPNTREPLSFPRSRETSATPTPPNGAIVTPTIDARPRKVVFETDASILLLGVRGVGKSSLGFLAASAYSRRLVESDRAFSEATGSSRTAYRKLQGPADYQRKHCEVLKRLLETNSRSSVIVCSFADLEGEGARLIRDWAQSHPVIYVTRDIPGIQSYIKVWSEERIQDVIRASEALLRDCSNYDFYNVSETIDSLSPNEGPRQASSRASNGPFLTLKRTEHDFLKLLRNVIGDHDRGRSHQSAYPLSQMSVDKLEFTSAVALNTDDVVLRRIDLDEAQIGVDAVQLEVSINPRHGDTWKLGKHSCFNSVNEAFALVRRSTILPIMIEVTHDARDNRQKQLSRAELLEYCLRLGPEYCMLDLTLDEAQLAHLCANKGRTNLVGEYVADVRLAGSWNGEACMEIYEKARKLNCNLVKITMPNGTLADSFAIQAFQQRVQALHDGNGPRLIAYSTGRQGRTSMCLNNILTPVAPLERLTDPNTPDSCPTEERLPLVTAKERSQALFANFIHESMHFLIYGANVSFSLSPAMHNAAYQAMGMPHSYRTHSASTLDDFVALVREHDFGGAAIVQPFKTKALPMMDLLSPHAKAIGALNTVIPLRDEAVIASITSEVGIFRERNRTGPVKALYGDNTDWIGIRACIRRGLSPANTVRPQTTGLVCGAGGMARAAIYSMISLGVQNIFVCNRTKGNAEELAEHYNRLIQTNGIAELGPGNASSTKVQALESFKSEWPKNMRHPTMVVSTIPTQTLDGMPTNFTLPKDWLSSRTGGVVVELAYMPIVTPLVIQVQQIQSKGWILMDGLDMLPEQAFAQFELFTGRRAPRKLMRDEIFKHYSEDFVLGGALNTDSP
ncbi:Putative 3-dehydroquinate dehydratase type I, shikimate dehydrogenase substrate binding protein [Septoria linicola]|uniref:3-dehydroquinate dehydratase type I, shikimate dehydrogenase substrate binding protein n=1 Tax=Septoria linicola TaxID=215465 RepID=A0A9Q9AU14_9PEZI|nr:Putative 3-dehydroquinate dehydratase type I, shikimate dehydrogenase substrate binding protein [Septoria linicola]